MVTYCTYIYILKLFLCMITATMKTCYMLYFNTVETAYKVTGYKVKSLIK